MKLTYIASKAHSRTLLIVLKIVNSYLFHKFNMLIYTEKLLLPSHVIELWHFELLIRDLLLILLNSFIFLPQVYLLLCMLLCNSYKFFFSWTTLGLRGYYFRTCLFFFCFLSFVRHFSEILFYWINNLFILQWI